MLLKNDLVGLHKHVLFIHKEMQAVYACTAYMEEPYVCVVVLQLSTRL